jgi:L-erythro-3,5-diaminohexanoate dehydrogenase
MSAPTTPWYASPAVLGVTRAVEPPGALPHIARVVDAAAPILPEEAEIAVEALNVDATSYRVIRERCDGDAGRMADCIAAIVRERGKLQNPWTGSGGILAGRVTAVGERHWDPDLRPGDRVVPLASLIAIPLELEAVGPLAPASPQVPVRGRAVVTLLHGHVLPGRRARRRQRLLDDAPRHSERVHRGPRALRARPPAP